MPTISMTVRIPDALKDQLEREAELEHRNLSNLVVHALREYVDTREAERNAPTSPPGSTPLYQLPAHDLCSPELNARLDELTAGRTLVDEKWVMEQLTPELRKEYCEAWIMRPRNPTGYINKALGRKHPRKPRK